MKKDAAESFHPVPSIRRAREKNPLGLKQVGESDNKDSNPHGPVKRTEVEKHSDGTAHVIAHHEDGHPAVSQHANEADAHDHAKDMMAGGDSMRSDGAVDTETEAECPSCGGKMVDGVCAQCGYTAKPTNRQAGTGESDNDGDEGY